MPRARIGVAKLPCRLLNQLADLEFLSRTEAARLLLKEESQLLLPFGDTGPPASRSWPGDSTRSAPEPRTACRILLVSPNDGRRGMRAYFRAGPGFGERSRRPVCPCGRNTAVVPQRLSSGPCRRGSDRPDVARRAQLRTQGQMGSGTARDTPMTALGFAPRLPGLALPPDSLNQVAPAAAGDYTKITALVSCRKNTRTGS